jgi:hypothetical protein
MDLSIDCIAPNTLSGLVDDVHCENGTKRPLNQCNDHKKCPSGKRMQMQRDDQREKRNRPFGIRIADENSGESLDVFFANGGDRTIRVKDVLNDLRAWLDEVMTKSVDTDVFAFNQKRRYMLVSPSSQVLDDNATFDALFERNPEWADGIFQVATFLLEDRSMRHDQESGLLVSIELVDSVHSGWTAVDFNVLQRNLVVYPVSRGQDVSVSHLLGVMLARVKKLKHGEPIKFDYAVRRNSNGMNYTGGTVDTTVHRHRASGFDDFEDPLYKAFDHDSMLFEELFCKIDNRGLFCIRVHLL